MDNYRVAFFDIDGTLADNQLPRELAFTERVPDSAKKALKKLKENKIEPVIASGRHYRTLLDLANSLGVDSIISSNGNCVHYQGALIHQNVIPTKVVTQLIQQLKQATIEFMLETPNGIYYLEDSTYRGEHPTGKFGLNEQDPLPKDIVQLIVPLKDLSHFKLAEDSPLIIEKVAPFTANIHLKTGTKAEGIQKICSSMGIDTAQALAFGDEENDFTMFHTVGFPVAMGNATPSLKEKAAYVTDSVSNDGIWKACLHLNLISEQ
ncbi:Cof-type HAD-IIB family hydrolase [Enterococcus hermanniensis]|uniref:Cof-like hydrolase n=1 Tax=Enterococcus hermanniensis TaxID=249189 RepID=A0A1L8TJJ5_9ENTE|nr:Cof-type HAD-IIB family hydrolase [Enterococcus hermanniensis]OJG44368.1 cof-like hydrolase [Enterococcus hermanniensis]